MVNISPRMLTPRHIRCFWISVLVFTLSNNVDEEVSAKDGSETKPNAAPNVNQIGGAMGGQFSRPIGNKKALAQAKAAEKASKISRFVQNGTAGNLTVHF